MFQLMISMTSARTSPEEHHKKIATLRMRLRDLLQVTMKSLNHSSSKRETFLEMVSMRLDFHDQFIPDYAGEVLSVHSLSLN